MDRDGRQENSPPNLATNEVVNVMRRFCPPEVFDVFYKEWHLTVGQIASLTATNLEEIAMELKLKA